jgi:hypothetical protein
MAAAGIEQKPQLIEIERDLLAPSDQVPPEVPPSAQRHCSWLAAPRSYPTAQAARPQDRCACDQAHEHMQSATRERRSHKGIEIVPDRGQIAREFGRLVTLLLGWEC